MKMQKEDHMKKRKGKIGMVHRKCCANFGHDPTTPDSFRPITLIPWSQSLLTSPHRGFQIFHIYRSRSFVVWKALFHTIFVSHVAEGHMRGFDTALVWFFFLFPLSVQKLHWNKKPVAFICFSSFIGEFQHTVSFWNGLRIWRRKSRGMGPFPGDVFVCENRKERFFWVASLCWKFGKKSCILFCNVECEVHDGQALSFSLMICIRWETKKKNFCSRIFILLLPTRMWRDLWVWTKNSVLNAFVYLEQENDLVKLKAVHIACCGHLLRISGCIRAFHSPGVYYYWMGTESCFIDPRMAEVMYQKFTPRTDRTWTLWGGVAQQFGLIGKKWIDESWQRKTRSALAVKLQNKKQSRRAVHVRQRTWFVWPNIQFIFFGGMPVWIRNRLWLILVRGGFAYIISVSTQTNMLRVSVCGDVLEKCETEYLHLICVIELT